MLPPGSGIASPEASCSSELSVNKWQGLSHNINSVQAKLVTNGICRRRWKCLDRCSIAARSRSVLNGCSHSVLSEVGRYQMLRLKSHNNITQIILTKPHSKKIRQNYVLQLNFFAHLFLSRSLEWQTFVQQEVRSPTTSHRHS